MITLLFSSGGEYVKYVLDRKTKEAKVATSKTNLQLTKVPWKYLFDKGKEKVQESITDKFNDEEFVTAITISMMQNGYARKQVNYGS